MRMAKECGVMEFKLRQGKGKSGQTPQMFVRKDQHNLVTRVMIQLQEMKRETLEITTFRF